MLLTDTQVEPADANADIRPTKRRRIGSEQSTSTRVTKHENNSLQAPTPHGRVNPNIDRVHLARYTMGDLALENEILGMFAAQLPGMLENILQAKNNNELVRAAHTLKGSARAIGAWPLAEAAEKTEKIATAQADLPSGAAYKGALKQLQAASDATLSAICPAAS